MKQSVWNRLLSFMLAAAMLFSLISSPAAAWAAEEDGRTAGNTCGDNATWSLVDGVLTISGTGNTEHYEDESTTPWTDQRDSITKVVIESGITGIGDSLARCCTNLVEVEIPDTVTYVGGHAFSGCTSLTRITLPEGITRIGYSAFANSGLTVVTLPSTVTQVEWNVFDGCTALNRVVFTGDAPTFTPDAFVNVTTTVSYPENNATWTSDVLQQYGGNITWEGYTLGAGGGEEDTCVEGEVCHGDSTLGVHICAYNFPDAIMENCVSTGFDQDRDDYLSDAEIAAVTNIDWTDYGIQRLDGIHYFTNLTHLSCGHNGLTTLDLSANTKLQQLQCNDNQLTSLDVTGNPELSYIDCGNNQLTELNISGLTKLESLWCYENALAELDTSTNTALAELICYSNALTALDLTNNLALGRLDCGNNALTALDVTHNTALYGLGCSSNQLETLDVSTLAALEMLYCGHNRLTELDVSTNTELRFLECSNTGISELNITQLSTLITLDANYCQLTQLDTSNNPKLSHLAIQGNPITAIDLSNNTNISELLVNNTQLTELDVSMLPQLYMLELNNTDVTSLDLSQNPALRYLHCGGCKLATLDLSSQSQFEGGDINGQHIYGYYAYTEGSDGCTIDMAQFVGADNIGRIEHVDGAEYNADTGIATFGSCPENFWYAYPVSVGNGDTWMMEVYIHYGCEHQWVVSGCDRTCSVCGEEQMGVLHSFTRWMIYQLPTATEEGLCRKVCVKCGALNQTVIPAGTSGVVDNSRNNHNMYETWLTDVNAAAETVLTEAERNTAAQSLAWLTLEVESDYSNFEDSVMEQQWHNLEKTLEENEWIHATFELKLLKQIGTDTPVQVTDLGGGQLAVSMRVEGWPSGDGVVYQAVFANENGFEVFDAQYDADNGILTFTTTQLGFHGITVYAPEGSGGEGGGSVQEADPFVTDCPDSTEESLHICQDNFPDENFRNFIQENYDQDGDGYLTRLEAGMVELHCAGRDIHSLEGLRHFSSLQYLNCENNAITELDLTGNPELQNLFANSNPLVTVDLSQNTKLVGLYIGNTTLKQLDVSNNTQLRFLIANQSQLEALDVTMLSQLETLELNDTDITSLDLSQSAALRYLHCWGCKLPTLDLSGLSEECYYDINGQVIFDFYDYTEDANGLTVDMAQFVGADNIGRIDFIDGAEYDPATGIARFEGLREEFWYPYRVSLCNGGETTMEVHICYGCEHQWIISGCDRTCAACGEEQLGALHQFTRWMIRELPTATTEGSGYRECVNCGQEDQTMIPAGMSGVVDNSRNNDNMFETWLTDVSAAAETVLTEDERNAAAQSLAWLTLEMDGDYSDVDGSIMEQRWHNLESSLEENEWIQITFDLKLHKQMGTDAMVQVTDLGGGELSVSILAGGWPWGNNVVYQAVYVDENGWEAFDANYNHYNGVLTFTTTKLGLFGITMSDGSGSGSNQEADPFVTECPDSTEDSLHICADNFPDENFRMFIQESYDQDGDGYLSRQEAGISEIHCEGRDIRSLAGLQHFSHLWGLFCENNALTALDVSGNPNLGRINCNNNQISQLDVSSLANLEILYCGNNRLTQLDVSSNTNMVDLSCPNNQLTELDVSNNPALMFLGFENNSISYVDISMLTKLESLHCGNNKLTELDLSNKPNLRIVYCFRNELSALDVSASTELMELHFDGNKLTEIDLSNNSKLEHLNCSENKITQLDVSHMTNLVVLRCNRNKLSQLHISSLTKLEVLDCSNNLLETLQVSSNTALKEIHASYNLLTALDTANCTQLEQLNVDTNMIQSVDLRNNTNLTFLNLRNNELSQVDVTMLPELTEAQLCMNDLTQLDVSRNTKLRQLSFPENEITFIDLSNNPELIWIVAYQTPLTAIDLSAQTKLEWLDVNNTNLTGLDLSSNTALAGLQCGGCKLRTLDLSNQANLYDCSVSEQSVNLLFQYAETAEGYEVDMTQFVGADNLSRIQSVDNASYDPATGIATFDGYPGEVVYYYDMAMATNPGNTMFIRIWNECDHQWESQNCHWTCSICGNTREEHTFGLWTVVELPTATTEGTKEKICSLCGTSWTELIPVGTSGLLATTDECVYDGRLTDPDAAGAVVLTDAEKAELANGALAVLTLNTKEINNTVSKLETVLVMNTLKNREEIGMYLDIQLYKQLGLNPVEQIASTGDTPVAISITVPHWLCNPAYEYRVIRVVGREVSVLTPAFYNYDSGELSFETDVFGTFVLTVTRPEAVSGELTDEAFWHISSDGWLYIYGNGAMPDYAGAGDAPWQEYADRITVVQVEDGITHIALYAFSQFPNLREAYIANTVTSIGEGAFMNSERLGWVSLAEVQEIGANAFRNCVALTDIHIPASVRSIGNWAFSGCTALNSVAFSGNAPSIGENAFAGVTATVSRPDGNESWTEDVMQQYGGTLTWNAGQEEEFRNIYADTVTWVEHFEDNYGVYRFTPEHSHTYYFQSLSDDIPYGILVDSNDNVLAESDSENACFDFSCWLEAGQTYYLGIRTGGWGGGFDMIIRTQHSYQEEAVTEATCTVAGIMRFTCTECGDCYEGEYFADHSFGEDNICTVCGTLNGTRGSCGDDLTYTLVDGVVTVSGTGDMWGYEWGDSPFGYTESITQVIVEEGVTGIGAYAFLECYGLTSISLPSTLTTIGDYAFAQCHSLGGIELPESVTTIGAGAFQSMHAMTGITLPQSLTSIGSYAFSECYNLGEIQIPASVTFIGDSAFRNCNNLSGIWVSEDNANYCSDSYGVLLDKGMTQLIKAPGTLSGEYAVPAGVNAICSNAFENCHNLNTVILPEGITEIHAYAFDNCGNLTSITLPSTLTTIGGYAFMGSGLQEITIPAGVTSIADLAFHNSYALRAIWVDADNAAYSNDSRGVLFNKDKTRLIAMPCALGGRYVIPDTVTEITSQAFSYSKLTTVWVSGNVAEIPGSTFAGCNNLKEVVILGDVAAIRDGAFADCNNLQQILFLGDAPTFGYVDEETGDVWSDIFMGVTATVYYPADNATWTDAVGQSYGGDLTWVAANLGTCGDDLIWIAADSRLTVSGSGEMYDYSTESAPWISCYFTRAAILDGITHVSNGAFAGCMDMKEIHFLGDAPTFGETAFFNSSATVYYPAGNTTWTEDLFQHYGGYMTWESYDFGYATLPLDTEMTVDVESDGTVLLKFTPAVTDRYYFCSVAGGDTYGTLYDINLGELASNDDDGSLNFGISYVMEVGQTYYLEVRHLNWEACTITVLAQQTHDCTTEVITEATCMQEGLLHHICNYCGNTTEETYFAEHSYGEDNICTVCGDEKGEKGTCGDNLSWSYLDGVLTISGTGAMSDFEENGAPWQQYMDEMTELRLEGEITYIGSYAFYNYTMWFGVTVPTSVTRLGAYAFQAMEGAAPTEVYFYGDAPSMDFYAFGTNPGYVGYPYSNTTWNEAVKEACGDSIILKPFDDQLQFIDMGAAGHDLIWIVDYEYTLRLIGSGRMAAYYMADMPWMPYWDNIQRIEMPEGLENIRGLSFCNITQLTSITIPSTVAEMGNYAIADCANLESIYFTGDAPFFDEFAFANLTATVYYPAGNDTWTEAVMQGYGGNLTWETYEIGDSEEPTEPEEPEVSWNDNLTWNYADGVLTISGTGAMNDYGSEDTGVVPWYEYVEQIHTVIIEEGVTNVGAYAFYGCTALTTVNLPASVTAFGQGAFFSSGLTSFVIPATVTTVGSHIFAGCNNLTTVEIMGDLNAITDSMFFSSGLTTLTIHGSIDRIGPNAFFCTPLTGLEIPEGVTAIDWAAFNGCSNLEYVTLPSTLTSIGDNAFFHCTALKEINLPNSLKTIGGAAFAHCEALTELVIPAWVSTIAVDAFWCCTGVSEVTFLGRAPSIGEEAFYGMTATVYYPAQKSGWTDDVLQQYGGTLTWRGIMGQGTCGDDLSWILYGDGELVISGTGAMWDYNTHYAIPWYKFRSAVRSITLGEGITYISSRAFEDCSITEITIPQTLTRIGSYAFCSSSLESIVIPNSVTSIGNHAFGWCSSLHSVTLPESLAAINSGTFYSCRALRSTDIPESVTTIGTDAFYGSGLTSVEISANITSIGGSAFAYCDSLTGIYVDENNERYCSDAQGVLFNKEMTTLIQAPGAITGAYSIPTTVTTVGQYAFYYCTGLEQITIPAGVEEISSHGFWYCTGLTEVTLPESLTTLGDYAFCGCSGLTSVEIPAAVTSIGAGALRCENLTGIWVAEDNANYSSDAQGVLYNKDKTVLIQVHGALSGAYTIAETVTTISDYAFADCDRLTAVTVPGGVTTIEAGAFDGCTALEEINLSEGVTTIGADAFKNCDSLVSVNIPASVTSVSATAFDFCDNLTGIWVAEDNANYSSDEHGVLFDKDKIVLLKAPGGLSGTYAIPSTVMVVGNYAFYSCRKLTGVEIPESVTTLVDYAFAYSGLTEIVIPDSVENIGTMVFADCSDLKTVVLPQNITYITSNLFNDCIGLKEITIPASVTSIQNEAFVGCTGLRSVKFLGTAPAISANAFNKVKAAVQYPAGDSTWTAAVRGNYCGTLTWVAYGYDLSGASVSLGDNLDMHFFVPAAYVADGCYAVITRTYADGREDHVVTVGYDDWNCLNDELLYVTYSDLAAKEMNDVLSVVIYDTNGNVLSNTWTDSIHNYAMRMLAREDVIADTELRTVYVDMLNYGTAAQTQFGYDTEHLANADLTDEQQSYATTSYETESNLVSGTGRAGTSLTLKNRITLDLFFSNVYLGKNISDLQAVISYVDHYGRYVEILVEGEDFKSYGSRYTYVSVPGLAIADYGQVVECAIYDADWNLVVSAKDSIEGYAHRMAGKLPGIVDAIMKFGVSAYNYFH